MTTKIIRWGIIGAGNVAEVKSGPGFYQNSNSQLLAVMRRRADKARDFAERHGVTHWYSNADELMANPNIDAIYIATPPAQHKDYALAALAAGKHVYIEKPVAMNAQECDEIIAAEQNASTKVCVAHYRRFVPCFMHFAALMQQGAIGKPLLARIDMLRPSACKLIAKTEENWRIDPSLSGGGLFHDLSPHQLDLLLHWFGPVVKAQGFGTNQAGLYSADDCVIGWARLQTGVELQGRWHFAVPPNQSRDICEVIGTEGSLSINFFGEQVIQLSNHKGQQTFKIPNPLHIQQPMIEQVNAYFRGERDNPCSVTEAKAVMALIDCFTIKD